MTINTFALPGLGVCFSEEIAPGTIMLIPQGTIIRKHPGEADHEAVVRHIQEHVGEYAVIKNIKEEANGGKA